MQQYIGKTFNIVLTSGRYYTGTITEIIFIGKNIEGGEIWLFTIIDKFGLYNSFPNYEIKKMEEYNPKKKKGEK